MKLFIMESVNYFGKKGVQDGNCIFAASTESLESQWMNSQLLLIS